MSKPAGTDTRTLAVGKAHRPVVIEAAGLAVVEIPYKNFLLSAQYARIGDDLLLTAPDGTTVLVRGFFSGADAPSLLDGAGAQISGELVTMLATSPAAGQTADAAGNTAPHAIGIVEKIDGSATFVRADGSRGTLTVGTLLFERDAIETGPGSRVALLLVDKVALAMEASTRLVLDSLQADWGENGRLGLAVLKGTLSYAAGPAAPEVSILTPQASISATARAFTVVVDDRAKGPYATDVFVHDGVALINAAGTTLSVAAGETAHVPGLGGSPSSPVAQTPDQVGTYRTIDALAREVQATGPMQQGWQALLAEQSTDTDGPDDPALARIASIAPAAGGDAPAATPRPSIGGGSIVTMVPMPGSDPVGAGASASPAGTAPDDAGVDGDSAPGDLPPAGDDASAGTGGPSPGPAGNQAPIAVGDTAVAAEDGGPVSVAVLGNDTDADAGDTLTIESIDTAGTVGTVSLSGGELIYNPGAGFQSLAAGATATDTFAYTVRDTTGATSTATVTVTITGTNDAPLAVADAVSIPGDASSVVIDVLANDTDPDGGDTLTVIGVDTTGSIGTVGFSSSGVTHDPTGGFQFLSAGSTATDTFSYTMRDAAGLVSTAIVTVTVIGVNNIPLAVADGAVAIEDGGPVSIDVLANDTDPDGGDVLAIQSVDSTGTIGTVGIAGAALTYDPGAGFQSLGASATAIDSFTYTIVDSGGLTATIGVVVTISGVNDAPVAQADAASAMAGAAPVSIDVLANDADIDIGDSVIILSVDTTGTIGGVSFTGSALTYDPGAAFSGLGLGATATDTFTYTIRDAAGAVSTATVTVSVSGADIAPVAAPDAAAATEDNGQVSISVLANDTDADAGDSLSVLSVDTTGTVGSVSFTGSGVTYDPGANFQSLAAGATATDTFTYTIRDLGGLTSTASVTVTVSGVNDAPMAVADAATVVKDGGPVALAVLANDTDVDAGDSLSVLSVDTTGTLGQVTFTGSGVSYDPGSAFLGLGTGATATDTFTYTIRDAAGAVSTASVTVTVTGSNQAPAAVADSAAAVEDGGSVAIAVLANDTDADAGDSLSVLSVDTTGTVGSVSFTGSGVTYDPGSSFQSLAAGATVMDSFTYTIRDAAGATSSASVTVTITGTNDAPIAVADSLAVVKDSGPVALAVLGNDTDVDTGDSLTVLSVDATGTLGQVSFTGSGVSYDPGTAFSGLGTGATATDTFTYTIRDAAGAVSTASVTVTITGSNQAPLAVADSATAIEDGGPVVIAVLANDTDADAGDSLSVLSVDTTGTVGSVSFTGSGVTYDPGANFQSLAAGATATDSFTYTIRDAVGATSSASVTVTITGTNDTPVAVADSLAIGEDSGTAALAVLANDTDVDAGDSLSVVSVDTTGTVGSVSFTGSGVTYDPGAAFQFLAAGVTATDTFTYTIQDATGSTSTASVIATITGANDAPTAVADSVAAIEDGGPVAIAVLANDTDVDTGDSLSVLSVDTTGTVGSVSFTGSGVTYDPGAGFQSLAAGATATDTFTYTIRDAAGATSTASVTVTIAGTNDAPTAVADSAMAAEDGGPVSIAVLANDTDADAGDSLNVLSVDTTATVGSVSFTGSGVTYDPGANFQSLAAGSTATDTFAYTIRDAAGVTSTASVTVTVTGTNDAPVAVADSLTVVKNSGPTALAVLANDTDVDTGDSLSVLSVDTTGTLGQVTFTGSGVSYDPGAAFSGLGSGATATDTFTYTIRDAAGAVSTASVTVTITGNNQAPVAVADSAAAVEDGGAVVIAVLANDTDADAGDSLNVLSVDTTGTVGGVSFTGSGVTYDPGANFQSLAAGATTTDTFSYTIQDAAGATSTAAVTVTITGANDAPAAVSDTLSIGEDSGGVAVPVLANDTDPDLGDTLSIIAVDLAGTVGSVGFTGSSVTYNPGAAFQSLAAGATATDTFTYTIQDTAGATSAASVTVTITGANDAPTAVADSATAVEGGGPVSIAVLANDTDIDAGDTVSILSVDTTGTIGSVSIVGGLLSYDPGEGFSITAGMTATDTFTYTIQDAAGATSTASVTVTVSNLDDNLSGGGGGDLLNGMAGNDTLTGNGGNDTLIGGPGTDLLVGGAGNDSLDGGNGSDTYRISGTTDGTDTFRDSGASGTDRIIAGANNTNIGILGNFSRTLTGIDEVSANGFANVVLLGDGTANTFDLSGIVLTGLARIDLGAGNDTLLGSAGDDVIQGGTGNDSLNGGDGADTYRVSGTADGADTFRDSGTSGSDTIVAGANNTNIGVLGSFSRALTGIDFVSAGGFSNVVLLGDGTASTFDLTGIVLDGLARIDLGAGNDTILGSAGADVIQGGTGNDSLDGGEGGDTYRISGAGDGTDTFRDTGSTGIDAIVAVAAGTIIRPSAGFTLAATGIEAISGNGFANVSIVGGTAAEVFDFTGVTLTDIAAIDTGTGNDTVVGSAGVDVILGNGGNDSLDGGEGGDIYRVTGTGHGMDFYRDTGSTGADRIEATAINTAIGIQGNFSAALTGIEEISANGFAGVKVLGDATANLLDFSGVTLTGLDAIDGGTGNDTIIGTAGADVLLGNGGNDSLDGGEGGDIYRVTGAGHGMDLYRDAGTTGADRIVALANNTTIGIQSDFTAVLTGIEEISANGFTGVKILGDATANLLDFSGVILTGLDAIDGGTGNDTIFGTSGADILFGNGGNDSLDGGEGGDTYRVSGTGHGADLYRDSGIGGADRIVALANNTAIGIQGNFSAGLTGIEEVSANGFTGVKILGDATANLLDFSGVILTGLDAFDGGSGNDTIFGTAVDDVLLGNAGNDSLDGGEGGDTYRVSGTGHGADLYRDTGTAGSDRIVALANNTAIGIQGNFSAALTGIEEVSANGFTGVSLLGDTGANAFDLSAITLVGLARIDAGGGSDTVLGSAGADLILGNTGDDRLNGGLGNDTLTGGAGDDVFVMSLFSGQDRITDFTAAGVLDRIDLTAISIADTDADGRDFDDVLALSASDGLGNVLIDLGGGNTLTLAGVSLAALRPVDFIL